ncbi:protein FAR1-RELATED SEQUENCE 5-like [Coffea arabica]|uniref:Protein FAR1-RELATED SEQUENCE n=1 Tax=Coffea arabica TaxID=13443 RepID=A0ABM4WPN8_COFAR
MVKKHNLENNEWLSGLYRIRDKWARCMMKERWTAGMRSTQLSESLNAAIKNHLKLNHDLVQFFRHFNRVVDDKRHNELIAEYEMRQKLPMVGLRQTPILVHAAETYSPTVFVAFQNEYDDSTAMVILRQQDAEMFVEFTVMRYDGGPERIVVRCSCKKYENEGILCGHALKVFDTVGIKTIPPKYVKRRWTKRALVGYCFDRRGRKIVADPKVIISTRYRELAPAMIKVATRAAMSEDTSKVVITVISDLAKRVELLLSKSEEQPSQNHKNLNVEERDKIEIVNEMGEVSESEPTSVEFDEHMFMGCCSSTDSVSEERAAISTHCDINGYHVFLPSPQERNNTQGLRLTIDAASPQRQVDE